MVSMSAGSSSARRNVGTAAPPRDRRGERRPVLRSHAVPVPTIEVRRAGGWALVDRVGEPAEVVAGQRPLEGRHPAAAHLGREQLVDVGAGDEHRAVERERREHAAGVVHGAER
jgi:hypothetical protein